MPAVPELVANGIALFCLWLFAVAGWHKWQQPVFYADLLSAYFPQHPGQQHTVRPHAVRVLASTEMALALLILPTVTRGAALFTIAGLLLFYAAVMAWQLLQGRADIKCGCAGPASDTTISVATVWRNIGCAVLALLAIQPLPDLSGSFLSTTVGLLLALFLCLVYLCCEQLLSNAQRFALEKK